MVVEYKEADDIRQRALFLASKHGLNWLDFDRIHFYRYYCKTNTMAKCSGFSKVLQLPKQHIGPYYVLTFNEYHFNSTKTQQEIDNTIIHELLHIPKTFSGEFSSMAHKNVHKLANILSKQY